MEAFLDALGQNANNAYSNVTIFYYISVTRNVTDNVIK